MSAGIDTISSNDLPDRTFEFHPAVEAAIRKKRDEWLLKLKSCKPEELAKLQGQIEALEIALSVPAQALKHEQEKKAREK